MYDNSQETEARILPIPLSTRKSFCTLYDLVPSLICDNKSIQKY